MTERSDTPAKRFTRAAVLTLVEGISEEASAIRADWNDPRNELRVIQEYCEALRALFADDSALLSAEAPISRDDLETALNIGLAALGHFNTEETDKHWNEKERVLRAIEARMRKASASASEPSIKEFQRIFREERVKQSYSDGRYEAERFDGSKGAVPTWTITFTDATVKKLSGSSDRRT
jgi:hypothetical protein